MDRNSLLNDAETAVRYGQDGHQSRIWTAMPAVVQSVNLTAMTLVAQVAIQGVVTPQNGANTYVSLPPLVDVPICFPCGGGFILTFPIIPGDEVLIIIASRCIDSWWQSGGTNNQPLELRMHDLSDGFAIPGPRSLPNAVTGISATTTQLRNVAGTTYVEIDAAGNINLISPVSINVTAPAIALTGVVTITGVLTATDVVTATGVDLDTHIHSAVTPGVGDSGPPVP